MKRFLSPYATEVLEGITQGAALAAVVLSLSLVAATVLERYRAQPAAEAQTEARMRELEAQGRELEVQEREARLQLLEAVLLGSAQ